MGGKQNLPPMVSVHAMGLTPVVPGTLSQTHQVNVGEYNSGFSGVLLMFACQWQQPKTAKLKLKSSGHGLITPGYKQ